ncbi:MAG: hypothetical protein HOH04_13675 [Rhodospirillaceae bacterium]|nr:hypothetical protein [Rhodospirillaceae bacterium]
MSPEAFERATTYPYRIPEQSFIYRNGDEHPLGGGDELPSLDGRTPVLAVGSNQSPDQLARKFQGAHWGEIPVIRCELDEFDSVFSPHIASYGAIAATLQHAPGVSVTLFVTWLTPPQLERMHETEISSANYGYGRLNSVRMKCELGPALNSVHIYNSRRGTLCHNEEPIPVAEIPAQNRSWKAMSQLDVQDHVCRRLAPEHDLQTFIRSSIDDQDLRFERSESLKTGARVFDHPGFTEISI